LSLRDVKRCLGLFRFFRPITSPNGALYQPSTNPYTEEEEQCRVARAALHALCHVYYYRIPDSKDRATYLGALRTRMGEMGAGTTEGMGGGGKKQKKKGAGRGQPGHGHQSRGGAEAYGAWEELPKEGRLEELIGLAQKSLCDHMEVSPAVLF